LKKKLRIAINAQIPSGSGAGGIETVLRFLTSMNRLEGDEEYVFVGHWSDSDWLEPLLGERQTLVRAPQPESSRKQNRTETLKRVLGPLRPLARDLKRLVVPPREANIGVTTSDGFFENLNCDVIHFPYQDYVRCPGVPTIYNPHDLQHLHYPKFFAPEEIQRREAVYPAACRAAEIVVVASQFVKQDVIERYGTETHKIQVIPWSPPAITSKEFTEKDAKSLFGKYECPPRPYILYPAMTWEHKNHIRLLEAVALLRESEGLKINVICTGHKNSFYPHIEQRLYELNLEEQVRFTGVVERHELSLFYRQAQFVIVPTLFEAASAPLFEAWQHDVAVACSSVTSLPEQAAGAALIFDAFSVEEIADAIKTMVSNEALRAELRSRGSKRLKTFDPVRTVKAYRAVYRKVGGVVLNDEDRHLLNWDWMRDS
jgi:glycosyltransferase involved in cell wall biosynthesis